jgi:hypothetical protein
MNRSYSKLRHIQESNILLEKRLMKNKLLNESEMGDDSMGDMSKGMCKTSMSQLLKDTHNFANASNDAEYYKRFYPKGFFVVKGGEAFEFSPGGTTYIRKVFNIDKTILMKEGGFLDVEFKTNGMNAAGDSFTLNCRDGKITVELTSGISGGA